MQNIISLFTWSTLKEPYLLLVRFGGVLDFLTTLSVTIFATPVTVSRRACAVGNTDVAPMTGDRTP